MLPQREYWLLAVATLVLISGCTTAPARVEPDMPRAKATSPPPVLATIGTSREGRPIRMEVFGDGAEAVLVIGGIHGDEPTGAALAKRVAEHLRADPALLRSRTVAIIAEANPDGMAAGTRGNANRVDVNRNFPASNWRRARGRGAGTFGDSPASEPETRGLLWAVERIKPARVVSIHSIRRGRHCNNFDGPARPLAELMAGYNGYPVAPTMGYDTPGSLGTWLGVDRGVPIVTLELPRDATAEACWEENRSALLAFISGRASAAR
jgi:hypothetical protein